MHTRFSGYWKHTEGYYDGNSGSFHPLAPEYLYMSDGGTGGTDKCSFISYSVNTSVPRVTESICTDMLLIAHEHS